MEVLTAIHICPYLASSSEKGSAHTLNTPSHSGCTLSLFSAPPCWEAHSQNSQPLLPLLCEVSWIKQPPVSLRGETGVQPEWEPLRSSLTTGRLHWQAALGESVSESPAAVAQTAGVSLIQAAQFHSNLGKSSPGGPQERVMLPTALILGKWRNRDFGSNKDGNKKTQKQGNAPPSSRFAVSFLPFPPEARRVSQRGQYLPPQTHILQKEGYFHEVYSKWGGQERRPHLFHLHVRCWNPSDN